VLLRAEAMRKYDVDGDMEAYQPKGCKRCGFSGYKGRVGMYEAMTVSKEIRELAIERSSADRIAAVAIEQGMRTLQEDGLDKVRMGITSIQEVARITGSAMAAD
jgi:type IV pilus assembly protein PilB